MTAGTQQAVMIPGDDEVEIRLIYGCGSCNAAEPAVRGECSRMITVCWPDLELVYKTCLLDHRVRAARWSKDGGSGGAFIDRLFAFSRVNFARTDS